MDEKTDHSSMDARLRKTGTGTRDGAATRRMAYRALHVALPVALVAVIVSTVGAGEVMARLVATEVEWVALATLACSAQIVLCALRWRATAERLGVAIPTGAAVAEYYLSSVINTTVPGGVVGDALRAVRTRAAASLEKAAQAVVIERLAGQIALGAVLIVGLALSGRPLLQGSAAIAAVAVAACAVLVPVAARRLPPSMLCRFLGALRLSWGARRPAALQVTLSLMIVAANLLAFWASARATGVAIGLADTVFAVPVILAAMLIPFSVAGWGYREGAAAAVFPMIGASAAAGVSASVVFGAVILVASLPGAAVLAFQAARSGRRDAARAVAR